MFIDLLGYDGVSSSGKGYETAWISSNRPWTIFFVTCCASLTL